MKNAVAINLPIRLENWARWGRIARMHPTVCASLTCGLKMQKIHARGFTQKFAQLRQRPTTKGGKSTELHTLWLGYNSRKPARQSIEEVGILRVCLRYVHQFSPARSKLNFSGSLGVFKKFSQAFAHHYSENALVGRGLRVYTDSNPVSDCYLRPAGQRVVLDHPLRIGWHGALHLAPKLCNRLGIK